MQEEQPKFSVIIPTGNRAHLAENAVESVLKQRYRNFEIIIADWAHTDEAERIALKDPRIIYLRTTSDKPYGGWNDGVRRASGDYVLWLDDDNYLLPYALELFAAAIIRTRADVITSSHLYYYDNAHPRTYLRNSLGIVPWSGAERQIDLRYALREIFTLKRSSALPRFHTSSTILSRRVIDASLAKLGFVLLDFLPNMNSFPIPFSFARSALFIDHPTVIVGRYGNSVSQNWAIMARHRFERHSFPLTLSPVCGYTRINGTLENYLTIKKLLPDFFRDIPIDYVQFTKIYMQELAYLDTNFGTLVKNWKNLFAFLKGFPKETRSELTRKALRFCALAPAVYVSRRLKLYPSWRVVVGYIVARKEHRMAAAQKINGKREFSIPLGEKYSVDSIASLAENVRRIVIVETNRDIFNFPRTR